MWAGELSGGPTCCSRSTSRMVFCALSPRQRTEVSSGVPLLYSTFVVVVVVVWFNFFSTLKTRLLTFWGARVVVDLSLEWRMGGGEKVGATFFFFLTCQGSNTIRERGREAVEKWQMNGEGEICSQGEAAARFSGASIVRLVSGGHNLVSGVGV